MTDLHIDYLGGNCPVQAEGLVNGCAFYFRARGDQWKFQAASVPGGDCFAEEDAATFHHIEVYGVWPEAGWMEKDEARAFIAKAVGLYEVWMSERSAK